jgi:CIC family chloride channel protein
MRSPSTSFVFAFELTHDGNVFVPLLVCSAIAYALTVLTLKPSILTEKVARCGYHLSREYAVDPLEILFAHESDARKLWCFPHQGAGAQPRRGTHTRAHAEAAVSFAGR